MPKRFLYLLPSLAAVIGLCAASPEAPKEANGADTGANVILLTLDGVRWEEVFQGVDPGQSMDANTKIFTFLTGPLAKQGPLLGDKASGERVLVGNRAQNSLPGYQSIMAGATQPCLSNACGRIKVETFPERLVHDLGLKPEQVATIASWENIALAVEHVPGTTFVSAGPEPLAFPGTDRDAQLINDGQKGDSPPWKSARYDKHTFSHALNYLKKKKPRFLFISLNDSDEWGHKGQYDKYVATLRQQDAWIQELVTTIDSMGDYGRRTTLLITTDHGRGDGNDWGEHGSGHSNSGAVWIYGRSPHTLASFTPKGRSLASKREYSHLDLRPTIEAAFGLKPRQDDEASPLPGKVIDAIVGPVPTRK
jgi:hypothetical protein